MGLLQTLCLVKMDSVDGNAAAKKQGPATPAGSPSAPTGAGAAQNMEDGPKSDLDQDRVETEMKG